MTAATRTIPPPTEADLLLVVLEGTFDADEAKSLGPLLDELPDGRLTLDFSRCIDVRDRGLAVLAELLASRERPVSLRGLRTHQRRLLRYLGLEAA
jgi:hypothetical protein